MQQYNVKCNSFILFFIFFCRLKHFCGVSAEPVESKSNRLHIRFFAEKKAVNSSFSIYYTAFTKKRIIGDVKVAECGEGELDCEDDTCISETLRCNHRNNCKFQKDEEKCNFVRNSYAFLFTRLN